eukprot:12421914-Karenia_brevis.AAC.1
MEDIKGRPMKPNAKQQKFLDRFNDQLKGEYADATLQRSMGDSQEPLLDLIHGFPGTGKSALISWMRELLVEGLGWQH